MENEIGGENNYKVRKEKRENCIRNCVKRLKTAYLCYVYVINSELTFIVNSYYLNISIPTNMLYVREVVTRFI